MERPIEKDYKDWTDYAEAMLAYKDWEAEQLREKVDFLDGGYQARNRRVTQMLNEGKIPTAWQLRHCSLEYLVDTLLDQLNKNKALKEFAITDQNHSNWEKLREKVQHMREDGDSDLRTILFFLDKPKAMYDE